MHQLNHARAAAPQDQQSPHTSLPVSGGTGTVAAALHRCQHQVCFADNV